MQRVVFTLCPREGMQLPAPKVLLSVCYTLVNEERPEIWGGIHCCFYVKGNEPLMVCFMEVKSTKRQEILTTRRTSQVVDQYPLFWALNLFMKLTSPEGPERPLGPATPGAPTPSQYKLPEAIVEDSPGGPGGPGEPGGPGFPTKPGNPGGPGRSQFLRNTMRDVQKYTIAPGSPLEPEGPGSPLSPASPLGPGFPYTIAPGSPLEPEGPGSPLSPASPLGPGFPVSPGGPDLPGLPFT
ncbi:hypothetical protein J437_LFUL006638 [Ladona fulva]|uniref:Uncharacterized protein n=1 Tax=Ladona fulva TaxID=123851 RepID=A0A8K0KH58_LADFU|nr:hypothetical protein J437_LFUL006638 [Ladona fulva]